MADPAPEDLRLEPADWDAAIADTEGPQLIVAGPGTGKTEFLVRRAVHLVESGIPSEEVLLLTFSRRAANDLRDRVRSGLGRSVTRIAASTFHSFASRIHEAHGTADPAALLTGPEHVALVGELLSDEDPDTWPANLRGLLHSPTLAEDVADFLLRCEERMIGPDELALRAEEQPRWRALPGFMRRVRVEMHRRARIDYGALLRSAVELIADDAIATGIRSRHRWVLVDEYQDTSPAQAALLDALTEGTRRITAAADPYQSIYGFRGADLGNVADFPRRFSTPDGTPARRIALTRSFRVPSEILRAAEHLTASGALPGAAGPVEPAPHAGRVEAYVFDQATAEAEWIATEVEQLWRREGTPLHRIAVLLRSKRTLLPELSRAMARRQIPHDVPDARLVDHPAVQIVFDLARAAQTDADPGMSADAAVRRLLLGPLFSLPVGRERQLLRIRRATGRRWSRIVAEEVPDGQALGALLGNAGWATDQPAVDGFFTAWERLPQFLAFVHGAAREPDRRALAAFAQVLARQAERDPSVDLHEYWRRSATEDFEATPLLSHTPGDRQTLTLTTTHQAKGLEFDVVFLADAVEGTFPDLRRGMSLVGTHLLGSGDLSTQTRLRLQEEMRLAYTATTRARTRVVWTATAAGIDEAQQRPSRFVRALLSADLAEGPTPPAVREDPITPARFEAWLRRRLADPASSPVDRLASATVLAGPLRPLWDARRFAGVRRPGPDTGLVPDGFRMSPTQAQSYDRCPRRYAFERLLRVEDGSSPYLLFGSLVHEALEAACRGALEHGRDIPTADELRAAADDAWTKASFGSAILDRAWLRKAHELLDRLAEEWPADARDTVDLERTLEMELDRVTWRGRVDRIDRLPDGRLRIVDYKTSASMPTVEEAAGSLQLGFYLLAAREDEQLSTLGEPAEAELWYPRARSGNFRRAFDPGRLDETRATLVDIAHAIGDERWEPRPGSDCRRCAVRPVCPVWPEGQEAYVT